MHVRRVLLILSAALLVVTGTAGAEEVAPSATVQLDAAPSVQPLSTTTPVLTAAQEATPVPATTAVPEATAETTPAPIPAVIPEVTPVAQSTPAPTATAASEAPGGGEATPAPTPMAAVAPAATAARPGTAARTMTVAAAAQATPTPAPTPSAPSECATPVEIMESGEPTPSADGVCRVSAAVCSILGTEGDDVLPGNPFDDIICGLGGDDRLDGGDGDDVLLGGDGDDVLVGGEGDDCMVGGPGSDRAENTEEEYPEVEHSVDLVPESGSWAYNDADGLVFDAAGRCTGEGNFGGGGGGGVQVLIERSSRASDSGAARIAPAGAPAVVVAGSSPGSGGLRLGLPGGRLAVRRGDVVRVRVTCSAVAPAELVLLAGSRRIAHKRFSCTPPERTVRVRLNDAGRTLVAQQDRVQARVLVLAGDRTVSRQVLLVSPDS